MLVSLNWLSDFVDLPAGLDTHELAERFTVTTAEVEGIRRVNAGDPTAAETVSPIDDWIIEIDNKSITHRPDLWGHYGIARELAAMLQVPLKPPALADAALLDDDRRPVVAIEIDDAKACPRYSAIMLEGVANRPSPALMQARLANVGMRPINALVDLTNYVMAELGQPLHAFDGDQVERIEVAVAAGGEAFVTLDAVSRILPAGAVMIQSRRRNVALAGVMGGLDSEVKGTTRRILLESANFDAAAIRRCAAALGHRTEASARFEKSLDPALTVLAIARFIHLARAQFPDLVLTSRLSDCCPQPLKPVCVTLDPSYVGDFIGKHISLAQIKNILEALAFKVTDHGDHVDVLVPSFRATKDIEGEADVIEEIARFVGYGNIEPQLPHVTVRHFEPNAIHALERRTLKAFCAGEGYHEVHDYNWYPDTWLKRLNYDPGPSILLRNPPAAGLEKLRRSVMPGLLHAAELNRRECPTLKLVHIGSVFAPASDATNGGAAQQARHAGLLSMSRSRQAADALLEDLKGSVCKWIMEVLNEPVLFDSVTTSAVPWERPNQTVVGRIGETTLGRLSVVPLDLRRRIDEHLSAWSIAVAELDLTAISALRPVVRPLPAVPEFPTVQLDFSVLVDASRRFEELRPVLSSFKNDHLQRMTFEGAYQGEGLPPNTRSLLLRLRIGDSRRTLLEEDIRSVSDAFEQFLTRNGLQLRGA